MLGVALGVAVVLGVELANGYHELVEAGEVAEGATTLFVAFGAGAHWGAALHRAPF